MTRGMNSGGIPKSFDKINSEPRNSKLPPSTSMNDHAQKPTDLKAKHNDLINYSLLIDSTLCFGCGNCSAICPHILTIVNGCAVEYNNENRTVFGSGGENHKFNTGNTGNETYKCNGCGECLPVCPTQAIKILTEP